MKPNLETELQEMIRKISESNHLIIDMIMLKTLLQNPLLSNLQCAAFFATNPRTLLNWRVHNGLKSRKIARRHYYLWSDIFDYISRNDEKRKDDLPDENDENGGALT